jgi:hypothetical protein
VLDDDQDRVADCDDGLLFTAAAGQAPVAGAQELSVRAVVAAMLPRTPASHGLPLPRPWSRYARISHPVRTALVAEAHAVCLDRTRIQH